ncbi:ABC transporter permease [Candidatus Sumerlaeota bacterium]|nr:ABC transporter permease [Candidatus Sumerlaeota bacterium]
MAESATVPQISDPPTIRIRPSRGWIAIDFRELWRWRELLYFLTWRDVKVKYKQTLLGFAWAVLVPVGNMVVLGTIFGKVAKLPTDGLDPYLFILAGLVPWQYFANSLSMSSNSLVGYSHLITKIYFPRLFVPLGICIANIVDFLLAFSVLLVMILVMMGLPAATFVLIPFLMLIAMTLALGMGTALSAMNVKYRDIKFVVPFIVQIWMYCSIIVPASLIREKWGSLAYYLYGVNPMAGVIEGIRWCLLHNRMFVEKEGVHSAVEAPWGLMAAGVPMTVLTLVFGLYYFKRMEKMFADIV